MSGFVHLHCHSEYSVLDGASRVGDLVDRVKEFGQEALAITDHGNVFAAVEFYQKAKKAGVKPIIGAELYVARTNRFDKSAKSSKESQNHFLLLCENEAGWHNLCRLSSLGYLEGFHYRPRVDLQLLAQYSEGLIATSSCLAGRIPQHILADEVPAAEAAIEQFLEIYGPDRFFVEIQDHGLPDDRKVTPVLVELAQKYRLPLVATNDSHYTRKEDSEAHDALLAIQTNASIDDENRFRFPGGPVYYLSSTEEMAGKFQDYPDEIRGLVPEAMANTVAIAERCNLELPLNQRLIPEYLPPEGTAKPDYLRRLVHEGLEKRYGDVPPEYTERADFELGVIEQMDFVDYFLVVWDLIRFAREQGIPVGPGRGSGAGSIVAYALWITNIDPMRYNLLFERFLNPERVSMPDFDLDFCERRRPEMIEYVRAKYGTDNVAQIITFGRMKAKAAVRNVARVLGMSYGEGDRIAKLIPEGPKVTLDKAIAEEPQLAELVKTDPQIQRLWNLALKLEGIIGNCGTHAAGVIICDQPLTDHVALFKASNSDTVATQVEMTHAEEVGLLKMDFLGLRTLTVVHDAVGFVRENRGVELDIDNLEPNDPKTYELLRSGMTMGVFQLESAGMRELARRIGLESLEELCALIALYRPGPMALKDDFIDNKHNPARIKYPHEKLEPILRETYGIALYQEQVMQIVQALAGFSLGQADVLRRAMGKKKVDLMAQQKGLFVEGCSERGIGKDLAEELFQTIETFAGYGFNKSHSLAYAYVSYQTAFLKANYPVEFMAAVLTSESNNLDKVAVYIEECRRMKIDVLPPDVNHSVTEFTVEGDAVRFGLGAVKNVGGGVVEQIVAERNENGPFKDIFDFCSRVDSKATNHKVLDSLVRAGAFDSTGWNRRSVESVLDAAIEEGQITQKEKAAGQTSLFELMSGAGEAAIHQRPMPDLEEWPESELLAYEKEMLGLYVTSHPLAKFTETLDRLCNFRVIELPELPDGREVVTGGLVGQAKLHTTSKGSRMAFLTLDTLEGPIEITVFSDIYEKRGELLRPEEPLAVPARVNYRNGEPGLIALDVLPLAEAEIPLAKAVHIRVDASSCQGDTLDRLAQTLGQRQGPCDVYLHCQTGEEGGVTVHANAACRVAASAELKQALAELVGPEAVWFTPANGLPKHQ